MKILLIDNYDSFTYMLKDYIEQCGADCTVIRNDDNSLLNPISDVDAIVLSPGPKSPTDAGHLLKVIQSTFNHIPLLGVCLGHQALGMVFGAKLVKARTPKHGKVEQLTHFGDEIFSSIPEQFSATRYHSLLLTEIPECLTITSVSTENEVMGIKHKSLPIWGIQFHPESCMTEHGLQMIKNFLRAATLKY